MADWGEMITPEERERLQRFRSSHMRDNQRGYDDVDLELAEFGIMYGWGAVEAYMMNRMTPDFYRRMLHAGRKVMEVQRVKSCMDMRQSVNAAVAGKKADKRFESDMNKRLRRG